MQIDANVAEADVGNVGVGQTVEFTVDAYPYRTFHGEVAQVRNAPITVQNVVTYDTVIAVTNDELKLKPGMTANVSIVIAQRPGVLKLPNAALRFRPPDAPKTTAPAAATPPTGEKRQRGGGGRGRERGGPMERTIFVLAKGQPQPVPVKLGITDGIHTELLEGLKENDAVLTGMITPQAAPAQPSSPFGGGGGQRRF
jgi:HlyD family secretion protein